MADEEPDVTEKEQVRGFIDTIHAQMVAGDAEFAAVPVPLADLPSDAEVSSPVEEEIPEDAPVDDSPSSLWNESEGQSEEPREIPIQNSAISDFVVQAEKEIETLRGMKDKRGQIERSMAIVQISERVLNAKQNGGVEERIRKLESAMTALWVTLRR